MKKRMKKGFTLVEIMIVVAIIAILAAIAIPNFVRYRKEAQQGTCETTRAEIAKNAEVWYTKNPTATACTLDDLAPSDGTGYFKTKPVCPAGGTYTITKNSQSGAWECTCNAEGHGAAAATPETPANP